MKRKLKTNLIRLRNNISPTNSFKISGKAVYSNQANILNTNIRIDPHNIVSFKSGVFLRNLKITVKGKGNELIIHENTIMSGVIELFGNNNRIEVGKDSRLTGAHLYAHNGNQILIGEGCLFSSLIDIRTTDSHEIYNSKGERINPDRDVIIHDRVWLGRDVTVLKGSEIESDSIVGSKSLVTGFIPKNTISGGIPAKVLKTGTSWKQ